MRKTDLLETKSESRLHDAAGLQLLGTLLRPRVLGKSAPSLLGFVASSIFSSEIIIIGTEGSDNSLVKRISPRGPQTSRYGHRPARAQQRRQPAMIVSIKEAREQHSAHLSSSAYVGEDMKTTGRSLVAGKEKESHQIVCWSCELFMAIIMTIIIIVMTTIT